MSLGDHPWLYLFLLLHLLPSITGFLQYIPTDLILLDCGASSSMTSQDGRNWYGDAHSKFYATNPETSFVFTASEQKPSVTQVPCMTARIFQSKFTYAFPVSPGPKFVRLYFYPATYSNFDISKSFFSLNANNYTLLKNFSASLTISAMKPSKACFIKEYIVTAWENQLNLTFSPSPSSFAFINGIEIVSMPNNLYGRGNDNPLTYVGSDGNPFYLDSTTALETFYRLNVGGEDISGVNDTGMHRTWLDDTVYVFGGQLGSIPSYTPDIKIKYTRKTPAYTAPELVYGTMRLMGSNQSVNLNYNLTWYFSVDAGFTYLVRLHFCQFIPEVTLPNQVVFTIFINNQTAEAIADVILWAGGNSVPFYKDYVVWIPNGSQSKQDLWVALHPYMEQKPEHANAFLNGLEIFKLNNSGGSLAGSNPEPVSASPEQHPVPKIMKHKGSLQVVVVIGVVFGGTFALSSILWVFFHQRKRELREPGTREHKSSWRPFSYASSSATIALSLPTDLCRKFKMAEIRASTRNFDDENVIGSGGFGTVYKGYIENGSIPVAIKRLDSSSRQGIREFRTEIEMLSRLRHVHLVSLIGYCDEQDDMILVYEFMANGTLRDHLYKTKNPPLPWKQRLEICIGAARGLHYLHTGAKHIIIHRDVKSSNILLDSNWAAKVSDFGISKTGPTSESQTHVSTNVRGSFGYLDPEYYRRQQLTEKSDVYSFGVVLFEVLSARAPVISYLPKEQVNLIDWARNCYRTGTLDQIIDPQLKGDIAPVSSNKFAEIAESCVRDQAIERPTMGDVVWSLEFALQLQETAEKNVNTGDILSYSQKGSFVHEMITSDDKALLPKAENDDEVFTCKFSSSQKSASSSAVSTGERSSGNYDSDRVRSGAVFSELMNPHGR